MQIRLKAANHQCEVCRQAQAVAVLVAEVDVQGVATFIAPALAFVCANCISQRPEPGRVLRFLEGAEELADLEQVRADYAKAKADYLQHIEESRVKAQVGVVVQLTLF